MIDLSDKRFGTWTALSLGQGRTGPHRNWLCRCDCGIEREVSGANLRSGVSVNCGCQRQHPIVHNLAPRKNRHYLYGTWKNMHSRCRPATDYTGDYGLRGISVCARWSGPQGFPNFLADMGERPPGASLDRIDNNGNYEPGNVRWADRKTQTANKRRHGREKISPEQRDAIRNDLRLHREIAADYGISRPQVSRIKNT